MPVPNPPHTAHRTGWGRHSHAFVLTLLVLTTCWCIALGFTLWRSHTDALANGAAAADLQARSIEEHLTQSLRLLDLIAGSTDLDETATSRRELTDRMALAMRSAPFLRSISLVDAQGRVEASTHAANIGHTLNTHGFFPDAQPDADILRIGWPWQGRDLADGHPVTATQPLAADDSSFVPVLRKLPGSGPTHWLVATLNPDYFIHHATQLTPEAQSAIQWLRYDGVLLFSTLLADQPGTQDPSSPVFTAVQQQNHGTLTQRLPKGTEVITGYRSSAHYPALVAVHRNRDALLSAWWQQVRRAGSIVLPVLLALSVAATLAWQRRRALLRRQREEDEKHRLAASVFNHAREGIMITDPQGVLIDVNDAFTHITGYQRHEVVGQHTRLLNSGRQDKEFYVKLWQALQTQGHWAGELWNRRKTGEVYAQVSTISSVRDATGQVMHYVALFSDISQQKENEQRLQHIAHFDALTGLPNRVLLGDRLRQAMVQTQRRGGKLALVFLDLDGFKSINDTHGHNVGDKLLIALSTRMKQALRDGDTLARLGGDEFVAVLMDLPDHSACTPVLDRLRMAAAQPILIEGKTLQVSGSLGVAFFPQNETVDADQLLRQADQAMYQAKLAGKNRFHVFDAEQDRDIRGRNANLEEIRLAMDRQAFRLYYQPKVNMRTGTVLGAEALIRWHHPQQGVLLPARFLPTLNHHPLSLELGYWVLETAMAQIETWHAAGLHMPVSVNVDAQQLQQHDFVDTLRALLSRHPQVRHGDLQLEVLETSALDDMDRVAKVIDACRTLGVTFALDDFGTGYSSLSYLRHLPTRQLKIDQSFVRDMLDDPDDLAILDGVIGLAIAFRRDVIAEGVETTAHGQLLLRLGCDWAQGYAIAKPMPADEFAHWVSTWRPPPCWQETPRTKREDLPLLFAAVEHRAWIAAVVGYLLGQRECPPGLNPRDCRLGHWIEHEGGRVRHGAKLQFSALETMHLDIHRLAGELIDALPQQQQNTDWLHTSIQRLHQARDTLLDQLVALQ